MGKQGVGLQLASAETPFLRSNTAPPFAPPPHVMWCHKSVNVGKHLRTLLETYLGGSGPLGPPTPLSVGLPACLGFPPLLAILGEP